MQDMAGSLNRGWHGQPSRLFGRYAMESGFDREYTSRDNYLDARRASHVTRRWFYLHLILDIYSRKIVGHEVHEVESGEHAAHLLKRTALAEGVHAAGHKPVLHGDNGASLKATTVLAMLHWLGIAPSNSRPRVSDDNAYVESLFRTAKYRPGYPVGGFADLDQARRWSSDFVHWYNTDHRHSGIGFVAPAQRHAGQDRALLHSRDAPTKPRANAIHDAGAGLRATGSRPTL